MLCLPFFAEAKIALNIGLIFKKGIGRDFFLSSETHTIEKVDEREVATVTMKNGVKVDLSAHYIQSTQVYGPTPMVRISGEIFNKEGKVVKIISKPYVDITLGEEKTIIHDVAPDEQIELRVRPTSI